MKKTLIIIGVIISLIVLIHSVGYIPPRDLETKAAELKAYCKKHNYNTEVGILVDYGRYSGRERFYLWDFRSNQVIVSCMCGQGYGGAKSFGGNKFSNEIGSNCSSLGHYKLGIKRKMYSSDRMAYELDGLDETNSNARVRAIILHQVALPAHVICPLPIPNGLRLFGKRIFSAVSAGCITIPFSKFDECSEVIETTDKPVIMWVYN